MEPALVTRIQDALRKTLDKFDQPVIWMDSAAYTKFAQDTYPEEKETIESLGLARTG